MLTSCLGNFMVWLVARAADTYFYCIKTTVLHFKWQPIGTDLPHKSWVTKFDRNLALHIHQKLTHFGMLSSFLGDFMVWLVARAPDTYFYFIKTTVLHFRWHIGSKIGQIWLHQISPKFVFEIFSGIWYQQKRVWPFKSYFWNWRNGWKNKMAISFGLYHLDWLPKPTGAKNRKDPKNPSFQQQTCN